MMSKVCIIAAALLGVALCNDLNKAPRTVQLSYDSDALLPPFQSQGFGYSNVQSFQPIQTYQPYHAEHEYKQVQSFEPIQTYQSYQPVQSYQSVQSFQPAQTYSSVQSYQQPAQVYNYVSQAKTQQSFSPLENSDSYYYIPLDNAKVYYVNKYPNVGSQQGYSSGVHNQQGFSSQLGSSNGYVY